MNDLNIINNINFLEQKDFEINSLEYEEAFKLDKRNYFQYYISLLKYILKQEVVFHSNINKIFLTTLLFYFYTNIEIYILLILIK